MAYRIPRTRLSAMSTTSIRRVVARPLRRLVAPWDELSAPVAVLVSLYPAALLHRLATVPFPVALALCLAVVVVGRVVVPVVRGFDELSLPCLAVAALLVVLGAAHLHHAPRGARVEAARVELADRPFPGVPAYMAPAPDGRRPAEAPTAPRAATRPRVTAARRDTPTTGGTTPAPRERALAAVNGVPEVVQPVVAPTVPARSGALPAGKGMWLYLPEQSDGGDVGRIIQRAKDVGLTHLYVRTGSSWSGFYAQPFLDQLLPAAHAAGIRVYGWDFPTLADWQGDAFRSLAAILYTTPSGDRIDGFAADIETGSEGTRLVPEAALAYGTALRERVGKGYPLIACVPRPTLRRFPYPYPHVVAQFDAIAPMVYWMNRDPGQDVADAIHFLSQFGKPVLPVGQAYDGRAEGGPAGVPSPEQLERFVKVSEEEGATAVSFWSWQAADQHAWDFIRDTDYFVVPAGPTRNRGQVRAVQTLIHSLGFPAPMDGVWDERSSNALKEYQSEAGLPPTGALDPATRDRLLRPFKVPLHPMK